jgi:hypothetical protein
MTSITRDLSWHVQFHPGTDETWPVITLGPDGTYQARPTWLVLTVDEGDLDESIEVMLGDIKIARGHQIQAGGLQGSPLPYRSYYLPEGQAEFIRPRVEAALAEIREEARKLGIDVREIA